jgi:hypothetical protein
VWFHVQLVNGGVSLLVTPFVICVMVPQMQLAIFIAYILQMGLFFYIMWVIYAFIKELQLGATGLGAEGHTEAFITKN